MHKLIFTRQGAVACAIAPLCLFLLFTLLMTFAVPGPFTLENPLTTEPIILIPMALMAFALPALVILTRWCVLRFCGGHAPVGAQGLLLIPAALLMWGPAALLCIPLYLLNLIWLIRGRYPVGQPLRWQPLAVLLAAVLLIGGFSALSQRYRRNQAAATAAEAFHLYAPDAAILAEIPQGEDTMLIISASGSGLSQRDADGWRFLVPYENSFGAVDGAAAASWQICRNPEGGEDVVIVHYVRLEADAPLQPRDTAGSEFTAITTDLGFAATTIWYAIVDADAPGYAITLE